MYGAQRELQDMRDQVEDSKDLLNRQRKAMRRLIGGMLLALIIIPISAVANGYDAMPNGGNGAIIAVCIIAFLCTGGGLIFFLDDVFDEDLASNYRKLARDLERAEQEHAEATGAQEWPKT